MTRKGSLSERLQRRVSISTQTSGTLAMAAASVIKVHGDLSTSNTKRVLFALAEKNVDFQVVPVIVGRDAHKKPEHLSLQPFGVVPVLRDKYFTVFESRAILRYIAEKYKDQGTPLYGSTVEDRFLVEQWLEVEAQNYYPVIQAIYFQLVVAPRRGLATDHTIVEANMPKLAKVLDVYEEQLGKDNYLAGNFFSLADLSHVPLTHALIQNTDKGALFASRKNVSAWIERISSRDAWKEVVTLG